jgi:hypothetical protein
MPDQTQIQKSNIETKELTVDTIQADTTSVAVTCNENVTITTLKGSE